MLTLEALALHVREGEADWQLCLVCVSWEQILAEAVWMEERKNVIKLNRSDTETLFRKERQQREKTLYTYIP